MSVLLLPAVLLVVTGTAHRLRRTARGRRRLAEDQRDAVEALRGLASELVAGTPPLEALCSVAVDLGGTTAPDRVVPRALSRAAEAVDGATAARVLARARLPGLSAFGSAWQVSAETGAALAASSTRLASVASRSATDAREVNAVLAGPRTTARLLAVLPVIGLLMAASTGADPLAFLLGAPSGRLCLLTGVTLDAAGLWWIERLASGP